MKVGEICTREVIVAQKGDSLLEAARSMREFHVGSVVVVQQLQGKNVPVGIVTDRDILIETVAEDLSAKTLSVEDIMVSDLATACEDDDLFDTIRLMRSKGVRRMPIVDRRGALVGLLALDDVLEFLSQEIRELAQVGARGQEKEARLRS
ncbi:MAG: CBS domain-containing protein [bacterium]